MTPAPGVTAEAAGGDVRVPFGERLAAAMRGTGPLCMGIDPHPGLLSAWALEDTAAGVERFSMTALEAAAAETVAAVKPQVALYERHGSAGLAVLERVLREAASAGVLTIADAKRGDIGSTMAGYADAWLSDGSPLAADAVTLSPYLGYESLRPAIDLAVRTGRGVFVLALTSNPEGASVQHVGGPDASVARAVSRAAAADNARAGGGPWGPVGLVVGATVADQAERLGLDLAGVGGALLAPGYGAQGATAAGMRSGFGPAWPQALATSSRAILQRGPSTDGIRRGIRTALDELSTPAG